MRFRLNFELNQASLSKEYRKKFISFLKASFKGYDESLYEQFYSTVNPKPYTFAVMLPSPSFSGNEIILGQKSASMIFSTEDIKVAMDAYNAFCRMCGKDFYEDDSEKSMKLMSIVPLNEKTIRSRQIVVKFLSPLIVREHVRESNRDKYYAFNEDGFSEQLASVIKVQLENQGKFFDLQGFSLTPLDEKSAKKSVILHYGQYIDASLGVYIMTGSPELLQYLYQSGISSRRSAGFGLFDVIE